VREGVPRILVRVVDIGTLFSPFILCPFFYSLGPPARVSRGKGGSDLRAPPERAPAGRAVGRAMLLLFPFLPLFFSGVDPAARAGCEARTDMRAPRAGSGSLFLFLSLSPSCPSTS